MASPAAAAAAGPAGAAAALSELLGERLAAPDGSEVATASLPARGVSLVGLYFGGGGGGGGGGGPGAQLAASLAAFYARFQPPPQAAPPHQKQQQRLELVFVSAEQDQPRWQEATRAMPWLALPFADKRRKILVIPEAAVGEIPWPDSGQGGQTS
uniref:Uncharacterized protein n=1 Tax=Sphaerodactylus townsendi TaxID=933632 RepID=A0ACB8ECN6_9SAUR